MAGFYPGYRVGVSCYYCNYWSTGTVLTYSGRTRVPVLLQYHSTGTRVRTRVRTRVLEYRYRQYILL